MDWDRPVYTLRTGTYFTSNCGVIGIDPELTVYTGYCDYDEDPRPLEEKLTDVERHELAADMIDRWQRYAAQQGVSHE